MGLQSTFYNTDGVTRTYPSTKHIASKQHVAVYFKSASTLLWAIIEGSLYDLVNNSIVFTTAPSNILYSQIEIRVADTAAELADSPSDIATVAGSIANVNTVSTNIASVNTVATNIAQVNAVSGSIANVNNVGGSIVNVNTVAGSIANVNIVATNITDVNSVATTIVPNIAEILLADTNAATATAAASSASTSASNALSYLNDFKGRYYGALASDPTLDPLGAAMTAGDLYFNTTTSVLKVYDGANWGTAPATASQVSNVPSGDIAATDVQGAINELDTEKAPKTNPVFTGTISLDTAIIFEGATPDAFETSLTVIEPTADNVLSLPNKSGTLATIDDITLTKQLQTIDATVSGNALTITLNQTTLDFRSTTAGSGAVTAVSNASPISLTIPDTGTLGTQNGIQAKFAVIAINNAGTMELAVVNVAGGVSLSEDTLISTTALSTASDSAGVIYSTTARTNVAMRLVGYINITEATAGTWATAPSLIQGVGGQSFVGLGTYGNALWANVTGSRSGGTTYYNTKGYMRHVLIVNSSTNNVVTVQGVSIAGANLTTNVALSFPVLDGQSYSVTGTFFAWSET